MNDPSATPVTSLDPELEALVGRIIGGKYSVLRLIGRGGMGAVYEAENVAIGKKVALKFVDRELAKDEQVTGRFAREARAASSVESANIVSVFDAGVDDGRPYLVMELLRGEDLGSRLRRLGRLPLADVTHVAAQVLRGLGRAHDAGIVHRDLKPDNVFLVRGDADPLFAKIVDFGVSKIRRAPSGTAPVALTGKGTVIGTPLYMSPEQARASEELDGRTDLYALGAIVFECLAGRPPHTGETYEQIILSVCMTDAPALSSVEPSVPAPVSAFVAKALARDLAVRFASAPAMLRALHEIAPDEKIRVPLDPMIGLTLPSGVERVAAGVATPDVSTTGPGPAGPPTDVSWSRGSKPARAATPAPGSPSRVTRFAVPLTAFGATLAGVVVTSWIVSSFHKPPTAAAPPTVTQAQTAAAMPSAAGPSPSAAPAPSVPSTPPAASAPLPATPRPIWTAPSPRPAAAPPPPPATAKPASGPAHTPPSTKPLDISRELPE